MTGDEDENGEGEGNESFDEAFDSSEVDEVGMNPEETG